MLWVMLSTGTAREVYCETSLDSATYSHPASDEATDWEVWQAAFAFFVADGVLTSAALTVTTNGRLKATTSPNCLIEAEDGMGGATGSYAATVTLPDRGDHTHYEPDGLGWGLAYPQPDVTVDGYAAGWVTTPHARLGWRSLRVAGLHVEAEPGEEATPVRLSAYCERLRGIATCDVERVDADHLGDHNAGLVALAYTAQIVRVDEVTLG